MKHLITVILFSIIVSNAVAQSQRIEIAQTGLFGQSYTNRNAQIYINANPKLWQIIKEQKQLNSVKKQIRGWRIRVYMGSGRDARQEAEDAKMKARTYFPDIDAHVVHQSPYFQVVVGDFRSRIEAESYRKKMLEEFPGCYVVESNITVAN